MRFLRKRSWPFLVLMINIMRLLKNRHFVIPVKTGIQYSCGKWIPAFAGMTAKIELFRSLIISFPEFTRVTSLQLSYGEKKDKLPRVLTRGKRIVEINLLFIRTTQ